MRSTIGFVGRKHAAAAVGAAGRELLQAVDAGTALLDNGMPRRNVHCIYGQSGIGKSEFLRSIGRWLEGDPTVPSSWGPSPAARGGWLITRADLESWTTVDVFLLRLRVAASKMGVPLRAFDVGLAARWATARDNEAFPTGQDRAVASDSLRGLIEEGASMALDQVGLGPVRATTDWLMRLGRVLAGRTETMNTIADCPYLVDTLDDLQRSADDGAAVGLAKLLSWDLSFVEAHRRPGLAVLLDTFEITKTSARHVERLVNELVWVTPSILWVIAGQEALDWADAPLGSLPHVGMRVWPELSTSASHRLPLLTDDEVAQALANAVGARSPRRPALDDRVLGAVADAAGGLPIYLDWAWRLADVTADSKFDGRVFEHGFPGVVGRLFERSSEEQRQALRAAAIYESFDARLVAMAGALTVGAAERFIDRSLIQPSLNPHRPSRVHSAVRAAILAMPTTSEDAWAADDWRLAAERGLEALEARHAESTTVDEALDAIIGAFELTARFGLQATWLLRAALQDQPRTEPVARLIDEREVGPPGSWSHDFSQLMAAWLARGAQRSEQLRVVASAPTTAPDIRRSALRRLAYNLRAHSAHEEVADTFVALRALPDGDLPLHRYQHALTLAHRGRFKQAKDLAAKIHESDHPNSPVQLDRLRGEVNLHHGHVREARDAIRRRAEHFEAKRSYKLSLEQRASEARLSCLLSPDVGAADAAIALLENYTIPGDLRIAWCARALACAGDAAAVDDMLERAEAVAKRADLRPNSVAVQLARAFDLAVRGEAPDRPDGRPGEFHAIEEIDIRWRRPIAWWSAWVAGRSLRDFGEVEWIEPVAGVRTRWIELVERRRATLGIA